MNTFLDYVLYFFFYSVCGWVLETVCCSIYYKKLMNRGFLTGPMCPIYGTGAVVLSVCLMPFYEKFGYTWYIIPVVILLGIILADTVEFLTSLIMEKLFNARWWDYSNEFLNIQGRICLKHSLYWGLATGIFIYIVHPFVEKNLHTWLTNEQRNIILAVVLIIFLIDLFFAVKASFDVRKFIAKIDNIHKTVTEKIREQKESGKKIDLPSKLKADLSRILSKVDKPKNHEDGKKSYSSARRMIKSSRNIRNTVLDKINEIKKAITEFSENNAEESNDEYKN